MTDKIRYGAGGVPYVAKDKSNALSEILEENPNVVEAPAKDWAEKIDEEEVKKTSKKGKKK